MAKMRTRQKLAIASWSAPQEGNIYGKLVVDATQALAYLEWLREKTGLKVTLTHLVGKAAAMVLKEAPSLNGRLVLGGYRQHESVDIAFLVALEEGQDLAKAKIVHADQKSVADIAQHLADMAAKLRTGKDEAFEKSKGPLRALPTWIIRPLVKLTGWLTGVLGINMPALGLEAFPFGGCIITSVGMFGIDEAYAPPTPWAHVPVYLLVGSCRDAPAVEDGALVVRKQLTITSIIDHRFIDGSQLGTLAKVMRSVLENPWQLEGMQGPPAA